MRKYIVYILLLINYSILLNDLSAQPIKKDYSRKVDSLLQQMTLEEKVGQMIQYSNDKLQTGPTIKNQNHVEEIKKGMVGSMFNIITVERARQYQDLAMQSRLKIPLIFGLDVVHGMRTIFPIPLGEAASFDLKMIKKTARIAASETSAYGIHWTFAPMVDIARDARWGRGMEGAGEDTWYGSQVAKARIEGFQGTDYSRQNTVLACAKHLAAYGAALAGKDYAEADISDATLHQVYLPPFHSAVKAGVATLMTGFNEINGIPATAHKYLQSELLKEKWGFKGFTVSDWGSIGEIARHGMGKDNKDATRIAVIAGCDMDMHSMSYKRNLVDLVNEGQVDVNLIDNAVRRILTLKYELGLFDDPYCYNNRYQELSDKKIINEHRKSARLMGSKSIVLLKNNQVLPIQPHISNIALIGPLNKASKDMLGNWKAVGDEKEVVTVDEGLRNAIPHAQISYIEGYDLENNELKPLPALDRFDMIIVAVGERAMESGEARSKVDINIHRNQQLLVKQLKEESNKPVVALIMGGRPLIFSDMEPYADAILMTWWLGSEAGNSVADILTGKYNPSGKLPVTFPKQVGQCPIYYNQKRTGRPWVPNNLYVSGYCDETALPAYPFGFGLSYTQFEIDTPVLEKEKYFFNEPIKVKVKVRNNGKYKGIETVQLYLQDVVSSITRPLIELCGIRQVELAPKEEKIVEFILFTEDLSFYSHEKVFITEPGEFKLFAGNSSDNLRATSFELLETRISSNK